MFFLSIIHDISFCCIALLNNSFIASEKQTILFSSNIFKQQKKKFAENKCFPFSPKLQKFHTAEITAYTVYYARYLNWVIRAVVLGHLWLLDGYF